MRRIRFVFALALAALWLPVTLHCAIEAITGGDLAPCLGACHDADETAGHNDADHAGGHDGCELVESGQYKAGVGSVKVAPPLATLCTCLLCIHALATEAVDEQPQAAVVLARPRDWVPSWHFVRRAAPAPRAPAV